VLQGCTPTCTVGACSAPARLCVSRHASPFYASAYYQHKALPPYWGVVEAGTLAHKRAHKGELLLSCLKLTTENWVVQTEDADSIDALDWALHWSSQLAFLGYQHHFLLGQNEETCAAFRAHWATHSELPFGGCGWLPEKEGWERDGVTNDLEMLWLQRYSVVAALARLGVNVALLDLDVVVHSDLYAAARARPEVTLFVMPSVLPDEGPNGGALYLQGAKADGPVVYSLSEVARRGMQVFKHRQRLAENCYPMDQEILRDVTLVLATPDVPPETWRCMNERLPDLGIEPLPPDAQLSYGWVNDSSILVLRGVREVMAQPAGFFEDTVNRPSFNRGWDDDDVTPPADVASHLVCFAGGYGTYTKSAGRANRRHVLQARGLWHGPVQSHARFVMWAPSRAYASAEALHDAIVRLMNASLATGRTPVLPSVDCASGWLERDAGARFGTNDTRVVASARGCHPMLSGTGSQCTDKQVWASFHAERSLDWATLRRTGEAADAEAPILVLHDWPAVVMDGSWEFETGRLGFSCEEFFRPLSWWRDHSF